MGHVAKRAYTHKHLGSCGVLLIPGDITRGSALMGSGGSAELFRNVVTGGFRGVTQ